MAEKKVYVASPSGFSELGRMHYEEDILAPLRRLGFTVLDPWSSVAKESPQELIRQSRDTSSSDALRIGVRNAQLIREADFFLAILDGPDVDAGVAAELGFAVGVGKRVVGYRGDFRPSGDFLALPVNAQLAAFIELGHGRILTSMEDLWKALEEA